MVRLATTIVGQHKKIRALMVALFNFTIRQTFFQKKIWFTLLLLVLPMGLTLMMRNLSPAENGEDLWEMFHIGVNSFIFSMILPLTTMLHGTALIGAEADGGTLAYLLTRKLRRSTVLLTKYAAMVIVLTVLVSAALLAEYCAVFVGIDVEALGSPHGHAWHPFTELLTYLLVTPFAVAAFLSIYVLIGLVSAKPLIASIMYTIVVEMFLANLPIGVRVYSVAHHLRMAIISRIPDLISVYREFTDIQEGAVISTKGGIGVLIGIILGALTLGCLLMSSRELIAAKVGSD